MIDEEKQRLRERMRNLARHQATGDLSTIRSVLQGLYEWKSSSSILLYAPLKGEPDPTTMTGTEEGKCIFYPRIEGEDLGIYRMKAGSRWVEGPYGLKEPDPESWESATPSEIDLALVPGLAFDRLGGRLGRGKGFYDRLLGNSGFRGTKIGICWEWQLHPVVPRDSRDIVMDLVIAGGTLHGTRLDNPRKRG
jgi:5-formyltetrahydrofolate cyclo-ligase